MVDMTDRSQVHLKKDLARADRRNIPVNLVYPANYPESPAILLEELISPGDALRALERISNPSKSNETRVVAER